MYKNYHTYFWELFCQNNQNAETQERGEKNIKMFFKFLVLTSALAMCQGTIPDSPYVRTAPLRFFFNQGMRRPGNNWAYQIVNGRPVISGFPNPNSYVAFGLNPQTGQVEQTQIIAQTRPGGPVVSMIQNMLHVAGQFFGQLTGAFGNAVGGALQTAGQFGQDIQDITNPVTSVTGVTYPNAEPVQQPNRPIQPVIQATIRPPVATPSVQVPTTQAPLVPANAVSRPVIQTFPDQSKSDIQEAERIIDQAIISLQTFRANVEANFQTYFESEEGQKALKKISEDVNWAQNKLQSLRETAAIEANSALQSAQNTVNTAFDNVEVALVDVAGTQGREFIEPTRNELNSSFENAIQALQSLSVNTATEIIPSF